MVRPTIRRKNLFLSYLARARTLTRAWTKRYTGIEAVMLTGGVSRGYADEMSELDLTLFLRPATYRLWSERCQSPLPEGDNLIGSWAVDLYYASIARERKEAWSPLKIWDRSFARVLYDPRGRLAALLREKVRSKLEPWSLHEDAVEADWYWEMALDWIHRTDVIAGHHLLNRSFDHFLGLLFRAQGELMPFDKWTFHLSRSLRFLPPGYEREVRGWLSVRAFPRSDIERRARHAKRVLRWWKATFAEAWLDSRARAAIDRLRRGLMNLTAFDRRRGARELLRFPLRSVAAVERRREGWFVHLDSDRLDQVLRTGIAEMHPYQLDRLRNAVRELPRGSRRRPAARPRPYTKTIPLGEL